MATAGQRVDSQGSIGQAEQTFSLNAKAKSEELKSTNQCAPFTIINFNPIPATLEGELSRYRIPSPYDERLPEDVSRLHLEWGGRSHIGHALTLREPHIYGRMGNATSQNGDKAQAIPQREVQYYLPVAIAYTFLEHYSPIFATRADKQAAAPPKDARRVYGVLAFEGDIHTLQQQIKLMRAELEVEAAGREYEGQRATISVPLARVITVGSESRRIFQTVQFPLRDYFEEMFKGQFNFARIQVARAQQKWSETQTVKDISESDRVWYRWLIKLGYATAPKQGEKHWLNEVIDVDGVHGTGAVATLRKCQSCRKPEPEPGTPFCSCGSPIDAYETYMAGHPVPDAYLEALTGEKLEAVLAERGRRRKAFKDGNTRGSYKQGPPGAGPEAGNKPGPDAGATELPGE